MGRVPRSPPCSAMPLYPCLITHWTVKYTSWPITSDKRLIKATRRNLIKRIVRCGEGVWSGRWDFFSPEVDLDTLKMSHTNTRTHMLFCACVCVFACMCMWIKPTMRLHVCPSMYVQTYVIERGLKGRCFTGTCTLPWQSISDAAV